MLNNELGAFFSDELAAAQSHESGAGQRKAASELRGSTTDIA